MSSNNIPLKLLRGYKDNLPTTIEDGMIYYCIDSNELFFDYVNNSTTPPTEHRYCLNPMVGETDYGDPVGKGLVSPEDKEIIDTAVRFVEQQLEPEQQKQARLNIDAVGEKTLEGGEIFNDYENNVAFSYAHTEGQMNAATGENSHAEGFNTTAAGLSAHSEGEGLGYTTLSSAATAGSNTFTVNNLDNFEIGKYIVLNNQIKKITSINSSTMTVTVDSNFSNYSAEGTVVYLSGATGDSAHSEGHSTLASGYASHAEGEYSVASGYVSHAEGSGNASNMFSHAEGTSTKASGEGSHAEGSNTIAASNIQHTQGKYNVEDANGVYAHIVGNGESNDARSNAHTLDWDGNAWFAGDVYIGGTSMDDATKLEASKPYMTKITLTASGWDNTTLTQVATIEGIKADETAQAIYINPVFDDTMIDEIGNCNVYASAQGENSITFSCDSVLTIDVEFYVKWQDVKWIKPILPLPNLIDFEYDYDEANDTYTLTDWKGTTNGVAGTEILVPNDERIII